MSEPDWTEKFIRPTVAAGVLFTDEEDRVLMVVPAYKDYLDIPGGYVEHGETPYQAAQREVFEELSIKPPIGRLLVADWWEDSPETGLGAKLLLVFDGGILGTTALGNIEVDGQEVMDYSLQPDESLDAATIPRLANRVRTACVARSSSRIVYLENGGQTGSIFDAGKPE